MRDFSRTIQESFIQYNQDLLSKDPKEFEEKLREWIENTIQKSLAKFES